MDWTEATIYAKVFPCHTWLGLNPQIGRPLKDCHAIGLFIYSHVSGGTDSDPNGDATHKRIGGGENRLTDDMLDASKGAGR
jgi:hypothetical protein